MLSASISQQPRGESGIQCGGDYQSQPEPEAMTAPATVAIQFTFVVISPMLVCLVHDRWNSPGGLPGVHQRVPPATGQEVCGGCFFVCCYYSVDVIQNCEGCLSRDKFLF
jgi:hypothetical protein